MTQIIFKSDIDVEYIDHMGNDERLAHAAWVSTKGLTASEQDPQKVRGVLKFLMEKRHGTPFECGALTIRVHAPIKVWREWHRHRIAWCLAGDTQVWAETYNPSNGSRTVRKLVLSDLCDRWNNGVLDILGRTRELQSIKNQKLRVLNEESHLFELGGIEDVYESGVKELYHLQTKDPKWNSLRCSRDHQVLTPDGWAKISELSSRDCIYVCGKRNAGEPAVPPSLRRGIGVWTSMQRNQLIRPADNCYICGKEFPRKDLILDHVTPVAADLTMALNKSNLKPACLVCSREKTNKEQCFGKRCIVAGSKLIRLQGRPQRVSEEMTYDIAMKKPWHNFVANGIVVHNSYNEESGRYKQLDPVFYIPPPERPMIRPDFFKSSNPEFGIATPEQYLQIVTNLKLGYEDAYLKYENLLALGVDRGLARDVLGVGIYSACYCTANPRSIMHFLELRTKIDDAKRPSKPLWEINQAALKLEAIFARHWPLTYGLWNSVGRMAP